MMKNILIAILDFLKDLFSRRIKPIQPVPDYIPDIIPIPPQKPVPEPPTLPKSPSSLPILPVNDNVSPYPVVPSSPNYGDYPSFEKTKLGIIARRICGQVGLSAELTTELLATIVGESGWNPNAVNKNIENGNVMSTDFGLCQINNFYHIGAGKDFPSVQCVMEDIEFVLMWMAKQFLKGNADLWVAHKNGAWKNHTQQIP